MHRKAPDTDPLASFHHPSDQGAQDDADTSTQISSRNRPTGYWRATRSVTYGFLAALPLFVLYESLILFVNAERVSHVRVGADLWIKQLLTLIGGASAGSGLVALGIPVLLIGLWVFVRERKRRPPLRMAWFAGLIAESAVYAVGVAMLVSTIIGLVFALYPALVSGVEAYPLALSGQSAEALSMPMMLVLSIGAGLYEELLFRVLLVGGLFWLFNKSMTRSWMAYALAAIIGAFLFSAVHYMGALGDPFTLSSFSFRFLFGLVLNGLFLVRGFGVAAWTHAIYDVLVVTQILG